MDKRIFSLMMTNTSFVVGPAALGTCHSCPLCSIIFAVVGWRLRRRSGGPPTCVVLQVSATVELFHATAHAERGVAAPGYGIHVQVTDLLHYHVFYILDHVLPVML